MTCTQYMWWGNDKDAWKNRKLYTFLFLKVPFLYHHLVVMHVNRVYIGRCVTWDALLIVPCFITSSHTQLSIRSLSSEHFQILPLDNYFERGQGLKPTLFSRWWAPWKQEIWQSCEGVWGERQAGWTVFRHFHRVHHACHVWHLRPCFLVSKTGGIIWSSDFRTSDDKKVGKKFPLR